MGRIQDKTRRDDKVSIGTTVPLSHISFSFKYLTSNKEHSFSYFGKDMRGSHAAYEMLLDRLQALCRQSMDLAKQNGKISGCEPIPYRKLSPSMQVICDAVEIISRDSSLAVFRFGQNNYRLLCKTDLNHPNLLHIIAFDFNYSAYDHGS